MKNINELIQSPDLHPQMRVNTPQVFLWKRTREKKSFFRRRVRVGVEEIGSHRLTTGHRRVKTFLMAGQRSPFPDS
jgi:hypothetical protein